MIETEVKLQVEDLESFRRKMESVEARLIVPRSLEDNYIFDYSDLRLRNQGCLLRVRITEAGSRITFKGPVRPSGRYKSREEWETTIGDGSMMVRILQMAGLSVWFRYQKYRTEYSVSLDASAEAGLHVALDETPVGDYVEIEGPEAGIDAFARRMGYVPSQFIRDSYYTLYVQRCRENGIAPSHMLLDDGAGKRNLPGA